MFFVFRIVYEGYIIGLAKDWKFVFFNICYMFFVIGREMLCLLYEF